MRRGAGRPAPLLPAPLGPALTWVGGWFIAFFALLGYYPERLAFTLLPLVLCVLAALLPQWPRRYARPLALVGAAGWHLYVLLSHGPFSYHQAPAWCVVVSKPRGCPATIHQAGAWWYGLARR